MFNPVARTEEDALLAIFMVTRRTVAAAAYQVSTVAPITIGATSLTFASIPFLDNAGSQRLVAVSSRTLLKAAVPEGVAYLSEAGREGLFVWASGDFASLIAADAREGIWIKANAIASSAGAWVRAYEGRIRAEWFGAVADYDDDTASGTNNNAAVAGMLAASAAGAIDGVALPMALPAGKMLITQLSASGRYISIHGDAMYGTVIVGDNATNDILSFGDGSAEVKNLDLAHITIDSRVNKTDGWAIRMRRVVRSSLEDIIIAGQDRAETIGRYLWDGVWFDGCDFCTLTNFQITADNIGLRVNGEAVEGGAQGNLFLDDGKIFLCGAYGIHVAGGFGGLTVGKVDVIVNNYGMVVDNAIVSAHSNREIFLQPGAFFDNSTVSNIEVSSNLQKLSISGGWLSSSGGDGLRVVSMDGQILIVGAVIKGNAGDGIQCDDADTQWMFGGCEIANNGGYGIRWTTAPANAEAVVGLDTVLLSNNTAGSFLNFSARPPYIFTRRSESGASTRPIRDKLSETLSVKDFGAVGDGFVVDRAAIQAAIDSLPASGGRVHLPAGTYDVDAAILVNKPVLLFGDGFSTKIRNRSATANTLTISGGEQVSIEKMFFSSSVTRSGGWYVDVEASANRFRLSDFAMDGASGGVRTAAVATSTIERGQILDSIAATGIGIRVDSGFDVSIRDILMDQGSQTFAGIYIASAGDVTLEDLGIIRSGQALYINPAVGQVVASVWANNCFFDNSSRGMYVHPVAGSVVRCIFDQCWFSSSAYEGVRLETSSGGVIDGLDFNGCHFFLNAGDGLSIIDTGVVNTRVNACAIAANTASGIGVAAGVSEFCIQGSRIGTGYGLAGNGNGISVLAGSGNYIQILNNDLRGNVGSNLSVLATGLNIITDNNLGALEAWSSYTPTVAASSGSITTLGVVSGRYQKIGKRLHLSFEIAITTNGTGASTITATLPSGMAVAADHVLVGRENSATGSMLQGVILAGSGSISITTSTNAYPGGSGYKLLMGGVIELQ